MDSKEGTDTNNASSSHGMSANHHVWQDSSSPAGHRQHVLPQEYGQQTLGATAQISSPLHQVQLNTAQEIHPLYSGTQGGNLGSPYETRDRHEHEEGETNKEERTLEVRGFNCATSEETICMFFESEKRSGGGEIESCYVNRDDMVITLVFKTKKVAERVLKRQDLTLAGATLEISKPVPKTGNVLECNTVMVIGVKPEMSDETLEMFFEQEKRSGGGLIKEMRREFEKNRIFIVFDDVTVASRVVDRGTFTLEGRELKAVWRENEEDSTGIETTQVSATIEVHGIRAETSDETIEMFFENMKRSGGGDIQRLERNLEKGVVWITFCDPSVASRVLGKRDILFEGAQLQVCMPKPQQKEEPSHIVEVHGVKQETSTDTAEMFFENERKSGGGDIEHIERDATTGVIKITYADSKIAERVLAQENLILEGAQIRVCRPQPDKADDTAGNIMQEDSMVINAIVVHGIHQTTSDDTIELFFENKRKSGGGDIAELERNPLTGDVTITFVDPEVADRVLERGLLKLEGATLTICRLTPPEPVRSVEIRGFHQNTSDDSLEMLFESKKRSGGGEIEDINIDRASGVAVITYKDHEVAARVIQHGESPGTILDGNRLHVEWPCEKSAPSAIGGTRSEDNQVETPKLDTIRVRGFHQESTTESLTLFFENRKRSGGGPVQNITMNEDKTEALITFPDPEVVNRILQKWEQTGLTLDKSSLDIAAVQPPPPVTYDLQKVCFKKVGVNVTTDLLENFIEAKTSYSVENITFGAIPGTVLVALSEPITDFDNFKANCSKKKLEGSNLVVERVPLTTSIQVHKLPQNITEDALENYFENEKKSGGGGVSVVHMASDSASAIVTFDNPEVVDRVLKKKHILNKTHVKVSIYHECLGILPPGHDPSKPYLPLPKPIQLENVEYGLVEFIKGIKRHRSAAEQAFADVSARIQWPQNPASMPSVTCALSQQSPNYREAAETWERNVREVMNKIFKEEFVYKEFSTLQAIWEKTNQALSLLPNPENDNYRLQTEDQTCAIRVMGEAGIANEVIQKITQIQKQLDEQMRRDALVVKEKKTLKPFQLRYLLAIQYKKIAKQMFPDMNISIDQEGRMLHLKGMPDDVNKAMIDVYERINALLHQTFKLPPASILLMETKECREHLVDLFRRESLFAVWVVRNDEVSVHATKQDEITHACQIIKQNIIETPVSIKDGSQGILNTEKWHATVGQQEKLYSGLCKIIPKADNSSVTIVAVKSVSGNVLECVSDFLTFNTVVEEFMKMERGKVTFLVERRLNRLREIEKENAENQVKIKCGKPGKSTGFLVQGNQPGIIATTQKLRDLCLKIKSEIKEINKPGMPKYILSQRGKDFLENVETKHDCTIDVPSSSGPAEEDGDFVIVDSSDINQKVVAHIKTPENCVVAIHRDDLTKQHVDVIVNAANRDMSHIGGLAKAIVDAGGRKIQDECYAYTGKHGALLDGQVFASSAGKLPCKKILHAVGPIWRGGSNNEENLLYEAVYNCLDEATKMKFESISFPALSAGVYRFPIDKCSEVILEAIRDFLKNSSSSVTEVRIVSLEERVLTAFQRALHGIFQTGSFRTEEGASYDGGYGRVSTSVGAEEHSQFTGLETQSCSSYLPTTDPLTMNTREGLLVSLRKAVLAQEMADIIVNTTSRDLKLANGAVSRSLLSAGGNVLQVECDQQAPNGLQFGDIVETSGGNLKCKRVFHGSCLNWSASGSEECLRKLVKTCLFTADKGNYTSIAIPAIGTGNLGFPKDVVARVMYEEIAKFSTSKPETTLREVRLVVYDKDHATLAAFKDEIRQLKRGRGRKPRRRGKESNEDISSERSGHSTSRRKANGGSTFRSMASGGGRLQQAAMVGYITLQIQQGDITEEHTDAIVNCTNDELDLSRGAVSNAIVKKGGRSIVQECAGQKHPRSGIVVTTAGDLPSKYIIHLVMPVQFFGSPWKKAITKCLERAEDMEMASICFPALGTGAGCDPKDVAKGMLDAIADFDRARKSQNLLLVRITIFQASMVDVFHKEMAKRVVDKSKGLYRAITDYISDTVSSWSAFGSSGNGARSKSTTREPTSLVLTVYADKKDNIDNAIKKIDELCESESKDKVLQGPNYETALELLAEEDVEEIKSLEGKYDVKITVELKPRLKRIRIQGSSEDIIAVTEDINSVFREVLLADSKKRQAAMLAKTVQWCYLDIDGSGKESFQPYSDNINATIEDAHSSGENFVNFTDENNEKCRIDFKRMKEICTTDRMETDVKRLDFTKREIDLPSTWTTVPKDTSYIAVDLNPSDQEYTSVDQLLRQTIGGTLKQIIKVQRIQNPSMFQKYSVQKAHMEATAKAGTIVERVLWHGTSEDTLPSINKYGFNRSYCGKNATVFGNGVYFAVNASYSAQNTYARPNANGYKHLYLCRVLTGEYVQGKSGLIVPPQKDPNDKHSLYDSVVDNPSAPTMFVIFSDTQAYPEFLVIFQ
ncbi:poly [ADP-ribose] polymerase 14 isoform X2 [Lingula anatina]|uniref:Poly [ADP-ribose] polymerase n=1 Tax=Lingula anatina TaxID=7574 RepID=A0A1S3ITX7_LINAN|nr:poly [ADP-ribose] polymerase 14 isoform X2 [Lingula anatina]|eukprot:XP_013401660.1 poly [ADP-ribose] polymerase 14 isoform X2 [Lingula anatina]